MRVSLCAFFALLLLATGCPEKKTPATPNGRRLLVYNSTVEEPPLDTMAAMGNIASIEGEFTSPKFKAWFRYETLPSEVNLVPAVMRAFFWVEDSKDCEVTIQPLKQVKFGEGEDAVYKAQFLITLRRGKIPMFGETKWEEEKFVVVMAPDSKLEFKDPPPGV